MPDYIIAFDYGTKSIGAAVGQHITQSGTELPPIKARDGIPNWDELATLFSEWKPSKVIVGLPLNMDDTESELAIRARKFANRIHGRFGLAIEMVDERLSTREAKMEAQERGHKGNYGKNPIDSIAARLILESWFHENQKPA